ncbi:MAG: hypothetical protein RQ824_04215 [bacterium]|nr:hypothetical protein [bacterium]
MAVLSDISIDAPSPTAEIKSSSGYLISLPVEAHEGRAESSIKEGAAFMD